MKSKKLIILSLIISIFTIKINDSNALLGFGAYTGLKLNYSIDNNKFNNNSGISFGVLGGIRLFDLRADLEYNMLGKAIDQSKIIAKPVFDNNISIHNISLNLNYNLFNFPLINILKVYVGGGIGETIFTKNLISSKIDNSFSWSIGGGITLSPLMDILNFDLGYKYIDFGKLKIDNTSKNITNHMLYFAIRFGF